MEARRERVQLSNVTWIRQHIGHAIMVDEDKDALGCVGPE